ncbi:MAG TPA: pseudouridine synthase [Opitutaceae bacterium]|nr:pseudouridine synthase [Opitutaceae bacterium]
MRRIDQLLACLGYGSRRQVREWLRAGRVTVRGARAGDPGERVDPGDVRIDGEPLDHPGQLLILVHKPAGLVCSHDPAEGPSVYGLLPERWRRRNPPVTSVGRLDKETTGLLLLTDCGAIVQGLTSPRGKVPKTYRATLDREAPPGAEDVFARGECKLPGEAEACAPATLRRVSDRVAEIVVTEGRYHQVRRMFASQGCTVLELHRAKFGDLELGELPPGQWIELSVSTFDRVFRDAGLNPIRPDDACNSG